MLLSLISYTLRTIVEDYGFAHSSLSLVVPILALIAGICFMIFYSGYKAGGEFALMSMLSHTDTPLSLVCGGAFALCVTLVLTLGIIKSRDYPAVFWYGAKSMFGAILILSLAWAIGPVIKEHIQTGVYLASVAKSTINEEYLVFMPVFLFLSLLLLHSAQARAGGHLPLCCLLVWR